jgi:hypothetical protein
MVSTTNHEYLSPKRIIPNRPFEGGPASVVFRRLMHKRWVARGPWRTALLVQECIETATTRIKPPQGRRGFMPDSRTYFKARNKSRGMCKLLGTRYFPSVDSVVWKIKLRHPWRTSLHRSPSTWNINIIAYYQKRVKTMLKIKRAISNPPAWKE